MTKRIKILLAVFLCLFALVVFSLYKPEEETTQISKEVSLTDTSRISKIIFINPSGKETVLDKKGNQWIINNTYPTRSYLNALLLTGLSKMEVKRKVAENAKSRIVQKLRSEGFQVRVFDEKGEELQSFYIMENDNDPNSSYYLSENQEDPVVVFVPGFEGSVSNVFKLDIMEWRDKVFFTANERTLQEISVKYPSFPDQSFAIEFENGDFKVKNLPNADTLKIYTYLNNLRLLTINNYFTARDDSLVKVLQSKQPLAILSLKSLADNKTMHVYEDRGKLYAFLPDQKEWVSLRTDLYNRLLVKRDFFK